MDILNNDLIAYNIIHEMVNDDAETAKRFSVEYGDVFFKEVLKMQKMQVGQMSMQTLKNQRERQGAIEPFEGSLLDIDEIGTFKGFSQIQKTS